MTEWQKLDVDPAAVGAFAEALGRSRVFARCLLNRGIDAESAEAFLSPRLASLRPPVGLAGLDALVNRLCLAVTAGHTVGVFGDYDVDGATSCSVITTYLRAVGVQVVPRVARRDHGYGFGIDDVGALCDAGAQFIVTTDCGTSDVDAIRESVRRGVDVAVIDHHTVPDSDVPHPALALVNPFRHDSSFPFRGLASVGLSFYCMAALRTALRKHGWFATRAEPDLRDLLDLVAVGTIADMVPLEAENRTLVRAGLERMRTQPRAGLAALLSGLNIDPAHADEKTVSWKIGPRLNAPGRLGDATPALELLLANDDDAAERARVLETCNDNRRNEQDRVMEEVETRIGDADPGAAVVIAGAGWAPGVVGIVAARLVDRFGSPAFVAAVDEARGIARGSARSAQGINLYQALAACEDLLVRFGGHAKAAGFTVRVEKIEAFHARLSEYCADHASGDGSTLCIDTDIGLGQASLGLAEELTLLGPFGMANPEPVLRVRAVRVEDARRVGDGTHLRLTVSSPDGTERDAIGFGLGGRAIESGDTVDIAFTPLVSTWRGRRRLEMRIVDIVQSAAMPAIHHR